ncbi:MAG TPA: serine/threonine protein phosphatase, partial [Bacteroidetes bacterium]|nr:serine/threonine protein phosphatase [Bacteroidota bacterium]
KGDFFGDASLQKVLSENPGGSLQELKQNIFDSIFAFLDGMPQNDDITFVLLKISKIRKS